MHTLNSDYKKDMKLINSGTALNHGQRCTTTNVVYLNVKSLVLSRDYCTCFHVRWTIDLCCWHLSLYCCIRSSCMSARWRGHLGRNRSICSQLYTAPFFCRFRASLSSAISRTLSGVGTSFVRSKYAS